GWTQISVEVLRFGRSRYAGKTSDEAFASYRRSGVVGKVGSEHGLQSLVAEALRRQESSCSDSSAAPVDDLARPVGLRIEAAQCLGVELLGYALPLEVGDDRGVTVPTLGEGC